MHLSEVGGFMFSDLTVKGGIIILGSQLGVDPSLNQCIHVFILNVSLRMPLPCPLGSDMKLKYIHVFIFVREIEVGKLTKQ